jgi:hypothetical protein
LATPPTVSTATAAAAESPELAGPAAREAPDMSVRAGLPQVQPGKTAATPEPAVSAD